MATKKKATKITTKVKVPTKSSVTAPKKKAVKKTTAKRATANKAAPKKALAQKMRARTISDEERYMMIQEAAYFLAEKHHFHADPSAIWVQAEQEVDALIAGTKR